MNTFDAVVIALGLIAVILGFNSGLLRSLAAILGYLAAAPIAVALTPRVMALVPGDVPPERTWLVLGVVFLAAGLMISALLRAAVGGFTGEDVSLLDRFAGALLGAVRIGLVAVLVVVIFDRVIPPGHEPPFLADSRLRPYLSAAGQMGLQSMPPEIEATIERLKREHGLEAITP